MYTGQFLNPHEEVGLIRSERGFTLLEILMGVTVIVFLATVTATSIEPAIQRARLEKTKARINTLVDGIRHYYQIFGYFPDDRLKKSFIDALENEGINNPHPLDVLALNPYPKSDATSSEYAKWNKYGPFVSSEFEKRSYLYDGWSQIIKYVCPFPYDEAGRYDETVLETDGGKCIRALVYSVGSDGTDNLVSPDPSDPFVEISWDSDINVIVIPPFTASASG